MIGLDLEKQGIQENKETFDIVIMIVEQEEIYDTKIAGLYE